MLSGSIGSLLRDGLQSVWTGAVMARFRKRPVVVDAIQFTGENITAIWDAFGCGEIYGPVEDDASAYIDTLEGRHEARPGDWIIRGVRGEFYPCKPDIFAATYEAAL